MNLANKLTLSRLFMVPFFVAFMSFDNMGLGAEWQLAGTAAALILFIAATVTDYYDGKIARTHGLVTRFGQFMDPLADKLIVMAAFVSFVEDRIFPAWMVIVILCREFLITGLRLLGADQRRVIQADRWGKNKTISQMTIIITTLVLLVIRDGLRMWRVWDIPRTRFGYDLDFHMEILLHFMMYIVVFFTLVSGAFYLYQNRDLLTGGENENRSQPPKP